MTTTRFKITGMTGPNCVTHVQKALQGVPGVRKVQVSIGDATVEHEDVTNHQLLNAIQSAGDYCGDIIGLGAIR